MKRYAVTMTQTVIVDANTEAEAQEKAIEEAHELPDNDYEIKELTDGPDEVIIHLHKTEQGEGGYMYEIYTDAESMEAQKSIDGGQCTGSYEDALGMAMEQAKSIK